MFDRIATRYDLTNTVLSFGLDRLWRSATRTALGLQPGDRCLDLAAGTGVSTEELARTGAVVIGCDFSLVMLTAGSSRQVPLVAGDALALPFRTGSFDAATITFGLRNVTDVDQALRELARVVRPGGRLVICEFSHPTWTVIRYGHQFYVDKVMPQLAHLTSKDPAAYTYLAESIDNWPTQPELATRIAQAGWSTVEWRNLTGGVVALHRARR
jgi:demethylmenaquinone methyltransferase / 2-methoxy-6-polyprenyl-1,4-benzoquinol methylase